MDRGEKGKRKEDIGGLCGRCCGSRTQLYVVTFCLVPIGSSRTARYTLNNRPFPIPPTCSYCAPEDWGWAQDYLNNNNHYYYTTRVYHCYHCFKIVQSKKIHPYKPGGYPPVHQSDRFNDRCYWNKLDPGGFFSTVWLARDFQQERLVALKLIIADALENDREFLRRLSSQSQPSRFGCLWGILLFGWGSFDCSRLFFPTLLDEFIIHGPNGDHRHLATKELPNLRNLMDFPKFNQSSTLGFSRLLFN